MRDMLAKGGIHAEPVKWNEADDALLRGVDAVLPLIAWGYHLDPGRWFDLLDRIAFRKVPVANPVDVLRWSSDKNYLSDLDDKGVTIVPSIFGHGDRAAELLLRARERFEGSELIVKPVISGSAAGTYRLGPDDPMPDDLSGKRIIVQPFLPAILEDGEQSLIYFGGQFSHAAVKKAKPGDFRVQPEFGGSEERIEPSPAVRALADNALAAVPGDTAYARIDVVEDEGTPRIMEVELVEPDLFLRYAPDEGSAFVSAVSDMLRASR
ncbi:ATP-grasp domain-containing protein [Sphingomicrobium lutaoense]|uniref:Glutathione synthase/RimK-type ligase-like ATP-grasp enzyme n=1 Tax=Sphingomicrobium lutaoense TaxID=515949 RepID=A0A839YZW3_9SPHN|nr:hypothetical protein [Sphingomicrobium lutaoense]MBB3764546.1 glutathione synthase/RimK-type ligase-like ATP-grasp enzyme [Sphingomicrobium lutaoense]